MKDDTMYSSAIEKDGLLDKSGASLRRAIKRLNHQAKKRNHKERQDWKR